MPRRAVEPSKKSVSLQIASSVTVAWESVLWPWFENVSPGTWKSPLPSLVLVPTRAQANDLKRRLIGKHLSHLGLHFVTPAGLRILLGREDLSPAAEPEHLRLILAAAATEMENEPNESEALAAKSVARSPTPLLRALDRLAIADWEFDQLG